MQQREEGEMERLEENAIEILHMMCERSECIICDSGGKRQQRSKTHSVASKRKIWIKIQSSS